MSYCSRFQSSNFRISSWSRDAACSLLKLALTHHHEIVNPRHLCPLSQSLDTDTTIKSRVESEKRVKRRSLRLPLSLRWTTSKSKKTTTLLHLLHPQPFPPTNPQLNNLINTLQTTTTACPHPRKAPSATSLI